MKLNVNNFLFKVAEILRGRFAIQSSLLFGLQLIAWKKMSQSMEEQSIEDFLQSLNEDLVKYSFDDFESQFNQLDEISIIQINNMQLDLTEINHEQLLETISSSLKGEDMIYYSTSLVRFLHQLLTAETDSNEIYIPFIGDPSLLHDLSSSYSIHAESTFSTKLIGLCKIIFDLNINLRRSDPLQSPAYLDEKGFRLRKFDYTVAIPPFGYKRHKAFVPDIFMRFDEDVLKSNQFEPMVISHIAAQTRKKAIIGFPENFANQQSMAKFREKYVINGWVSKVIRLPANLLNQTSKPCLLFVFDFEHKSNEVLMVDASDFYTKNKRTNILTESNISQILQICEAPPERNGFWKKVANSEFRDNGYSLDPRRYVVSADEREFMSKLEKYELRNLGDLVEIIRPQPIKGNEENGETWLEVLCNDIPEFGYMNSVAREKFLNKNEQEKAKRYQITSKDILLSVRGTIGKVAIIKDAKNQSWYPSQSLVILRPNQNKVIPEYLYLYMKSTLFNTVLDKRAIGSVIRNLSAKELDNLQIPMMSLADQQRIKEQRFNEGQELIEIIKDAQEKLKNIADIF